MTRAQQFPPQPSYKSVRKSMKRFSVSQVSLGATLLFVSLFSLPPTALAQQATALINGTVKDPSGAVVIGAKVTLVNSGTNTARSTTTNKDGIYLFPLVPIGTYELDVEQSGFDKYVQ